MRFLILLFVLAIGCAATPTPTGHVTTPIPMPQGYTVLRSFLRTNGYTDPRGRQWNLQEYDVLAPPNRTSGDDAQLLRPYMAAVNVPVRLLFCRPQDKAFYCLEAVYFNVNE